MGGSGNETTHQLRGENGDGRGQCWMGGSGNETTHVLRGENGDGRGQCWMGGSGNETTHCLRGEDGDGQGRCWNGSVRKRNHARPESQKKDLDDLSLTSGRYKTEL